MKLGLLTASLPGIPGDAVIANAAAIGVDAVELAAWPVPLERNFTAAHLDTADPASVDRIAGAAKQHSVEIAALAYYDNPLHPDPERRALVHRHLESVIDAAPGLDCGLVGMFVGRDPGRTVAENLRSAEELLPRFVDRAADRGVRLMIENCAMHGWHPDGYPGNLAYSPELWRWLETLGLWLNFDPSHLPPLGIDPVEALASNVDRVVHVHAKDVAIDADARNELSCHGTAIDREDPWHTGWWSYRLPGEGDLDWERLISTLAAAEFEGVVAIEHEDEGGPGTQESILEGVERAAGFLSEHVDRARPRRVVEGRTVG